jgi:uroporphyrinogen decarboxylase
MISRDRVIRTLNHQSIDRAPRDLWLLPGTEAERPDDVAEISARFPNDVLHLETTRPAGKRCKGDRQKGGPYTDAWGCTWQSGNHGAEEGLIESPLASGSGVATYEPPAELLDPARFAALNPSCEGTGRFTLGSSEVRPLDRICLLRGPEIAVRDLADGNQDLDALLARLHEFFRQEIELWAGTQIDGVVLGDDLTWVAASRAHLKIWRSLFKPLLREYCAVLHRHDKFAFFRCEGTSGEALDDLVEIGVDAVHAQWPQEEFEKHAARHRGRVTFWGGVGRRKIEPPSQCADIREAVFRVRKALDFGAGGVISQVAWGSHVPLQSIATFFEQWLIALSVTI